MNLADMREKYEGLPPTWFEFLLDDSLVVKHLKLLESNQKAEPSACQMIQMFLSKVISEHEPAVETMYAGKLRSLAVYVAARINWNLPQIMTSLPFSTQMSLLDEFKERAAFDWGKELEFDGTDEHAVMAHIIYSRWIVRSMTAQLSRSSKLPEHCLANINQVATVLNPQLTDATGVLQSVVSKLQRALPMPTAELSNVDVAGGHSASVTSVQCQLSYELGMLLFQQGKFTAASSHLQNAKELSSSLEVQDPFCDTNQEGLDSHLIACLQVTEFPPSALVVASGSATAKLVTRVEQCRKHCMQGVDSVLLEGEESLHIPLSYKRDIQDGLAAAAAAEQASPKSVGQSSADTTESAELHWQVSLANAVHSVVLSKPVSPAFWLAWDQADSTHQFSFVLDACATFLENASACRTERLLNFAKTVCMSSKHSDQYLGLLKRHRLSAQCQLPSNASIPSVTKPPDEFHFPWTRKSNAPSLERHLLSSSDVGEMGSLLQDLQKGPVPMPQLGLSEWWMKDRHSNHLLSVLLVKAQQQQQAKSFSNAEQILRMAWQLSESIRPGAAKNDVCRRLSDSQLSLDIHQWQTIQRNDQQRFSRLIRGTKEFINKACTTPAVLANPLLESCCIFLINMKEWAAVADLCSRLDTTRNKAVQLCRALVSTTLAVSTSSQEQRKHARALYDIVSELLLQPTQRKRTNDGQKKDPAQRAKDAEIQQSTLLEVAQQVTDATALNVLISCLVRINLALQLYEADENGEEKATTKPNDISCQYPVIWPVAVNNASGIDRSQLLLLLKQVLDHCMDCHSNLPSFLCSSADLLLVSQQHSAALRHYLQLGATYSNYFSTPVPSHIWTDKICHAMVACCQGMHAYTQATVLCQLLSPIDYKIANSCIQQANCHDAMELYYDCIWDHLILEFAVHTHSLRGEEEKRQLAVNALGHPDLNHGNSSETCRKAGQQRLTMFLRRMATMYL